MAPILAVMKKNILSIICGVLAIAAIVAIFWPIDGYFSGLQTQVDSRKVAYSTAKGLLLKPRTLPVLDPLSTDPVPLPGFPTDAVILAGKTATAAIGAESTDMLKVATTLVSHQPLVPNALPNGGTDDATSFRIAYQQIMTFPSTDPNQMQNTLPVTILHAGMPPTPTQVTDRQKEVSDQITKEKTETDANGNAINGPEVQQEVANAVVEVPDELRSAAARNNQMYIALNAFHINPALQGVNPPGTVAMFNSQVGLWLLQDVFSALASANEGKPYGPQNPPVGPDVPVGVPASVVKHLLLIDFADAPFTPSYPGGAGAPPTPPAPAAPTDQGQKLNVSPTGHVSNALYDVIPFKLKIIVDAAQVPAVLEALSKDRFITVLRMDMLTVDSGQAVLAGYVYGNKPVVQLNLDCEELLFRQDTQPYMPDSIKNFLGINPPPPSAAAQ